jgi:hypothetical protein
VTKRPRVIATRLAGPDHAVHTLSGGGGSSYRRKPCATCPWRVDMVGEFPAEAFHHSAATGYDASLIAPEQLADAMHVFACHSSGTAKPATCAGYILRSSDAIGWRMNVISGKFDPRKVTDGGHALHENYRAMAVANSVAADDPVLDGCPVANEGWQATNVRLKRGSR